MQGALAATRQLACMKSTGDHADSCVVLTQLLQVSAKWQRKAVSYKNEFTLCRLMLAAVAQSSCKLDRCNCC